VRVPFVLATAVASLLAVGISSRPTQAQEVAVVDIQLVLKNHYMFKTETQQLKDEAKREELKLTEARRQMQRLSEELRDYKPGSPEYKERQDSIVRRKAEFQIQAKSLAETFRKKEAAVYFRAYGEVVRVVSDFAKANRIAIVLQYRQTKPDPTQPETIQLWLRNPVVFQNNIDITERILVAINPGNRPGPGGVPSNTRIRGTQR
jgi:Skp family chaperone for outer membrane proteins